MILVDPTFFGIYCDRRIVVSVLAFLEMIRRWNWNFFRLENEHLNNCGQFRATKDIPLPFPVRPKSALYHEAVRRRPISIVTDDIQAAELLTPSLSSAASLKRKDTATSPMDDKESSDLESQVQHTSAADLPEEYATSRAYKRQDYAPSERPRSTLISTTHAEHDASMLDLDDEEENEEDEMENEGHYDTIQSNNTGDSDEEKILPKRVKGNWPIEHLLPLNISSNAGASKTAPSSATIRSNRTSGEPYSAQLAQTDAPTSANRHRSQTMRPLSSLFDHPPSTKPRTFATLEEHDDDDAGPPQDK